MKVIWFILETDQLIEGRYWLEMLSLWIRSERGGTTVMIGAVRSWPGNCILCFPCGLNPRHNFSWTRIFELSVWRMQFNIEFYAETQKDFNKEKKLCKQLARVSFHRLGLVYIFIDTKVTWSIFYGILLLIVDARNCWKSQLNPAVSYVVELIFATFQPTRTQYSLICLINQ